jgi:glycosyltransferase involved in cell wall biosynthesis
MLLSIIVPAYNEEKNLENNIKKFSKYLDKQNYDYEIIIVNDGSQDKTEEKIDKLKSIFPNIKKINNPKNLGKGNAVKMGFQKAKGKYRLFLDADNATSIDHLELVWPQVKQGFDIIIGSRNYRDVPGAYQKIKQPLWKRSLGISGNLLIQALTVPGIWDTQCGFKIFSKEALDIILPKQTINRWAFDVELLVLAKKNKLKIGKIPVIWENAFDSRVGIKGYLISLKEIIKITWNKISGKYN